MQTHGFSAGPVSGCPKTYNALSSIHLCDLIYLVFYQLFYRLFPSMSNLYKGLVAVFDLLRDACRDVAQSILSLEIGFDFP
jgi:hypothetical protein